MKIKVSLVLILLTAFCLHKIDKKHLIFHSHSALGCHSNFDNRENTHQFHSISNQQCVYKQGKSHHTIKFIQDNENAEIERETIDVHLFDVIYQVFSNNYSKLRYTTQCISINISAKIIPSKLYVIISVFRI